MDFRVRRRRSFVYAKGVRRKAPELLLWPAGSAGSAVAGQWIVQCSGVRSALRCWERQMLTIQFPADSSCCRDFVGLDHWGLSAIEHYLQGTVVFEP